MASLPTYLYYKCRDILLQCDEFDDERRLSSLFVIQELNPFRSKLPAATNKVERVELCISFLMSQRVDNEPALIFFLQFLSGRYHPDDPMRVKLADIANELQTAIIGSSDEEPLRITGKDKTKRKEPNGKRLIFSAKITILFLAADPTDASRLRLGEEYREIQEKLQLARLRDRFELRQRMSVRPTDISQALLDERPQIVHFAGHGTAAGELCFEGAKGESYPIMTDALAALFEQFADLVNCVVLNACYSEIEAQAIAEHIDYVVGTNRAIGDKAAIAFAVGFYQALGAGRTIEEAYKLGCVQIRLQGIPEHLTPVLHKKGATQP